VSLPAAAAKRGRRVPVTSDLPGCVMSDSLKEEKLANTVYSEMGGRFHNDIVC